MFFKIKSYFSFLLRSTNQHGVHSPFVFNLTTKCFYNNLNTNNIDFPKYIEENNNSKKQQLLLKKLYIYFRPKNYLITNTAKKEDSSTYDFIFFEAPHLDIFLKYLPNAHNDSVFIFKNIHKTPQFFQYWHLIIQVSSVKVSIDTYHLGIVFIRKEQVKEHFTIRV